MLAIVELGGHRPVFGITDGNGKYFQMPDGITSFFKSKEDLVVAYCFNPPNIVRIMFKPGHVTDIHDIFETQQELQEIYAEELL